MVSANQALPVPMTVQNDAFGRALPTDIIPPLVAQATALYALVLMQGGAAIATQDARIHSIAKGDTDIAYVGGVSTLVTAGRLPLEIWRLLRPYGSTPVRGMQMPVFRGGNNGSGAAQVALPPVSLPPPTPSAPQAPAGVGTELQYRANATQVGAVTGSAFQGGQLILPETVMSKILVHGVHDLGTVGAVASLDVRQAMVFTMTTTPSTNLALTPSSPGQAGQELVLLIRSDTTGLDQVTFAAPFHATGPLTLTGAGDLTSYATGMMHVLSFVSDGRGWFETSRVPVVA
jgi:hypothetical protein